MSGNHHETPTTTEAAEGASVAESVAAGLVDLTMQDQPEGLTALPSLMDRLDRFSTAHVHKYEDEPDSDGEEHPYSISSMLASDEAVERHGELQSLIDRLNKFVDTVRGPWYLDVYSPEEVQQLVETLEALDLTNRPTFDNVEADLVDYIRPLAAQPNANRYKGIVKRADEAAAGRDGMQFDTLIAVAQESSDRIKDKFFRDDEDREDYRIPMRDPEAKSRGKDLTPVWQFIADQFAVDTYGKRKSEAQKADADAYRNNCKTIDVFVEENAELLAAASDAGIKLRNEFVDRVRNRRRGAATNIITKGKRSESVTMVAPDVIIGRLVDQMHRRLGNKESGSGLSKGYLQDVGSALRLQYAIAHYVDSLNEEIAAKNTEPSRSKITTVEFED